MGKQFGALNDLCPVSESAMKINSLASNLYVGENDILFARQTSPVAYPAEGNDWCMQIEDASYWFAHRNRCILSTVNRFKPTGTLFDVGGGNGFVSAALQQEGFEVCVVEPGLQGAQNSRQRGVRSVVCAALEDVQFEHESLPAVGLFDVLEHIEADIQFLEHLNGLLVAGGALYLTVPAYRFLWSNDDTYAHHARRYTLRSLGKLLEATGFTIDFATYFFWMLPIAILLARTIPSRLGIATRITREKVETEHAAPAGKTGRLLLRMLRSEAEWIGAGRSLPFGSSCLIAAHKTG